jgi:hypothetical protein
VVVTSAKDSGDGSLRDVLASAEAGAVVGFDPGLTGEAIALSGTIELTQSVTLDASRAPGLIIDGNNRVRIFHFNGDAPTRIVLIGLTLTRGRAEGGGGAVSLNGGELDFEVAGCSFRNNAGSEGGAIRVGYGKRTNVFIHDSLFSGNDGSLPGEGNGFSGGAVSTIGGNVRVERCRFDGNQGPITGALYTIHSDPIVADSVFVGNRSTRNDGGSGAFFADGGGPGDYNTDYEKEENQIPGQITLRGTRFEDNRGAGDDSGAVEAYGYPLDVITVSGCVFKANRAEPGRAGALFIHSDRTVSLLGTAFVDNYATHPGGAIWADGSALYRIENSLFSGNVSEGDFGGALRLNIDEQSELQILSSTFVDNEAADGNGALWLAGERKVRIQNTIFANNTSFAHAEQVNFPVNDAGGNILWPASGAAEPTLPNAQVVDPQLEPLEQHEGYEVRMPSANSPAIDAAISPAPTTDLRNARRYGKPDIGAFERDATCDAK